jgi:cytoskeletal protein CcmA (bactofilin family)
MGAPSGAGASILGRGARVRGRIAGDGDLHIEGQVEGDVTVSGELVIDEGGSVRGDVGAGAVIVGGTLAGDVAAQGAVAVRATAQVEGNLAGAEVSLEEGASFHGRIEAEFDLPAELGQPFRGGAASGPTPRAPAEPTAHRPHGRGR